MSLLGGAMGALGLLAGLAGCGGGQPAATAAAHRGGAAHTQTTTASITHTRRWPPRIAIVSDPARAGVDWRPAATADGATAVWAAARGGVTLLRFDQHLVRLVLHAGSEEPGGSGWPGGDEIGPAERATAIAGFNGGFKLDLPQVGFSIGKRVGVPLQPGLASVVTYADGRTDIGVWGSQVPRRGTKIAAVLQNLHPLIQAGRAASTLEDCVQECWGATLGGGVNVARSALGIRSDGQLIWAGGESLSPAALAQALLGADVRRAIELDINPEWVAAYLYGHGAAGLLAHQATPAQPGIPGQLLAPYNRDFFTVLARR